VVFFFFSSRRRHTRFSRDWSSDVCSSDLGGDAQLARDLAMHIAASNPQYLAAADVPEADRAKERDIRVEMLKNDEKNKGKPENRSEERRVGKECRSRWSQNRRKKKRKTEG